MVVGWQKVQVSIGMVMSDTATNKSCGAYQKLRIALMRA